MVWWFELEMSYGIYQLAIDKLELNYLTVIYGLLTSYRLDINLRYFLDELLTRYLFMKYRWTLGEISMIQWSHTDYLLTNYWQTINVLAFEGLNFAPPKLILFWMFWSHFLLLKQFFDLWGSQELKIIHNFFATKGLPLEDQKIF